LFVHGLVLLAYSRVSDCFAGLTELGNPLDVCDGCGLTSERLVSTWCKPHLVALEIAYSVRQILLPGYESDVISEHCFQSSRNFVQALF
jgi:hypothetical protein